jgi:hypothetical protein
MKVDGHSGLEHDEIQRHKTKDFELVLSCLHVAMQGGGALDFLILHVSPIATSQDRTNAISSFLDWSGFTRFESPCKMYHERWCWWRELTRSQATQRASVDKYNRTIAGFNMFANKIDELFALRQRFNGILHEISMTTAPVQIFCDPVDITADPGEIPEWAEAIKSAEHKNLELQRRSLDRRIGELRTYVRLVTGTGEPLVDATIECLRRIGLAAEKTEKGATVDILAWSDDKTIQLGFEVTGLNDAIKKKSAKLTQVMEFERTKDDAQKTILLANTYNQMPVTDRPIESFTREVINFLGPRPVLLMTGHDLYRLVQDVITGDKKADDVARTLYATAGVFNYS